MGGLLVVDTLIAMASCRPDNGAPLWPKIIAVIAFDTPVCHFIFRPVSFNFYQYFGLHPSLFKHKLTESIGYAQQAGKIGQSLWSIGQKFTASSFASSAHSSQPLAITAPPTANAGWAKWAPAAYGVGGALFAGAAAGAAYYRKDDLGLGYKWMTDHMKYVGNLWDQDALARRMEKVNSICAELEIHFRWYGILFLK